MSALSGWVWDLRAADGSSVPREQVTQAGQPEEGFPNQADAESWIGENWKALLDGGAEEGFLLNDGETVYGPMSLRPPS